MLRLLTGFLLVCALAIAATAALVLQASPQVVAVDLNQAAAGLAALRAQDPRRLPAGAPASLVLGPREVELLLDRAGGSRLRWQVDFMPQQARLRASLPLPLALWLNAELVLRETDTLPQLERWRLGRLPLPVSLGNRLLRAAAQRWIRAKRSRTRAGWCAACASRPGGCKWTTCGRKNASAAPPRRCWRRRPT